MFIEVLSISHDLTLPLVGLTFQLTRGHDLIGSSRSVKIFVASPSRSTSGSKAYFLFKLHDLKSGESSRQQQLTTRFSSYWTCVWTVRDLLCPIKRRFPKRNAISCSDSTAWDHYKRARNQANNAIKLAKKLYVSVNLEINLG